MNEECLKSTSIHDKMEKLAKKCMGHVSNSEQMKMTFSMMLLQYYKSPSFDPTRPLRIQFTGQPAVDTEECHTSSSVTEMSFSLYFY